jgi:hypothetical protein
LRHRRITFARLQRTFGRSSISPNTIYAPRVVIFRRSAHFLASAKIVVRQSRGYATNFSQIDKTADRQKKRALLSSWQARSTSCLCNYAAYI